MSEWISVKKKLPKKNGKYLVYVEGFTGYKYIEILSFAKSLRKVDKYDFADEKGSGFYDYDGEWGHIRYNGVTHWMNLPEPPKEIETKLQECN